MVERRRQPELRRPGEQRSARLAQALADAVDQAIRAHQAVADLALDPLDVFGLILVPDGEDRVRTHLVRQRERVEVVLQIRERELLRGEQPDGVGEPIRDVQRQRQPIAQHVDQDDHREDDLVGGLVPSLDQLGALEVEEDLERLLGDLGVLHPTEQDLGEPLALVGVEGVGLERLLLLPVALADVVVVDRLEQPEQRPDELALELGGAFRDRGGCHRDDRLGVLAEDVLQALGQDAVGVDLPRDRLGLERDRPGGRSRPSASPAMRTGWTRASPVRIAWTWRRRRSDRPRSEAQSSSTGRRAGSSSNPSRSVSDLTGGSLRGEELLGVAGQIGESRDVVGAGHLGPAVGEVGAPLASVVDVPWRLVGGPLQQRLDLAFQEVLQRRPDRPGVEQLGLPRPAPARSRPSRRPAHPPGTSPPGRAGG